MVEQLHIGKAGFSLVFHNTVMCRMVHAIKMIGSSSDDWIY
jgi:hypothetical protein